ncbi:MAG TPA: amino acid adenylation domain-containing protein [Gordonia sp. (in: high G+C Gram-positive bacteria)]|nr:amino acid adenylation domain-containing protein [Gordonia sp. (in: high G+C Gram-positive bacteria)]HRC51828.1 amino acid adenylation domain-containing protein [Gordonia sp. (in: high G+C Gram-positive bacteria)]
MGSPIPGVGLVVLDARLAPVPVGVAGELYVSGLGVSRGYHGQFGLTASRFVADPFGVAGQRMYRTGDVVRWARDGAGGLSVEYVGRSDDQVKLRGLRIELGEVQAVLASAPGVASAVVVGVTEDGAVAASGTSVIAGLAGYVVAQPGVVVDVDVVREYVAVALPSYMVPSGVGVLDGLPLTPVGKLDTAALPAPVLAVVGEFVEPATDVERTVAQVFAQVLGVERVGATDSFFDLGGNSLSATRLVARVSEALGVALTIRDVFEEPTVRGLAARGSESEGALLPPVTAVHPRPERVPLSFAQLRMWLINQLDPTSPVYNIPLVADLVGEVDTAALRQAMVDVVVRHEVLRTTFPAEDGVPYQLIADADDVAARLDWKAAEPEELAAAVMTGFDVATQWPLRVRLVQIEAPGEGRQASYRIAIITHHIAADGESLVPLFGDLLTAYAARRAGEEQQLPELEVQFADFALWQHRELGAPDDPDSIVGQQLAYWTRQLAGLPDVLELPTDRLRPRVATHRGGEESWAIPAAVVERLTRVALDHGATPFMIVHAALAVLLARLSGTDDIAVGTPVAGRGDRVLDPLVGMFVNTLVLRTSVDTHRAFADLVREVRETDLAAFAHAAVPFETVVDAVDPARSEAFAPLAQVMLSYDPGGSVQGFDDARSGLRVTPVESAELPAQLDLYFSVTTSTTGNDWPVSVVYARDLFDDTTAQGILQLFVTLLDAMTADPMAPVGDAPVLTEGLEAQIAAQEHGLVRTIDQPSTVAAAVDVAIARTPAAVALISDTREVSYREFGARVRALAGQLIDLGVGPDTAVVVCMPRSVGMMIAVHAVVTAGGQYVPIDTVVAAERGAYMVSTAGAEVALVSPGDLPSALHEAEDRLQIIVVDDDAPVDLDIPPVTDAERRSPLRPDHAIYTLFTSGSTGRPKGVTLTHEAVVNRLWWGLDELPIGGAESGAADRVMQKTPYTFDCSVPELFAPLMVGAAVVVLADGGHKDPKYVYDEIVRTSTTMVHFVPSMLAVFLEIIGAERVRALDWVRTVSMTGEALPPATAAQLRECLPDALIYNLYGPTEAAVEITYEPIGRVRADDMSVPIGTPVWNSSAVVLDSRLHRVGPGVPGELYLGGVQLARGYASRPDLTAERFVADPYGPPGSRLYRTGDLVRRTRDGNLEYLGRTDFQVKLRGQRVELGEVEAALASAPGVVHAAATVADGPGGSQHLVGYLSSGGAGVDLETVKASVAQALPPYMVPTVWMVVDEFVLNSAGKLDRKALPEPDFAALDEAYVAPVGLAQERVAAVVAEVLDLDFDQVSATASFFDLGGNSLSATRLAAKVAQELDVDISVRDVFDAPTVREIAALSAGRGGTGLPTLTVASPRPDRVPLSAAQQRMWFLNRLDVRSSAYNVPLPLRLTGGADPQVISAALVDVMARHEVLRTVYPSDDVGPRQRVLDIDAAAQRLSWHEASTRDDLMELVGHGFDVSAELPLRGAWLATDDGALEVVVVVHHIAVDGGSVAVLAFDLATAFAARQDGGAPAFAPLPVQYADYALWQARVLGAAGDPASVLGRQLAYWADRLDGVPEVTDLPMDRPRPAVMDPRASSAHLELGPEVAEGISRVASRHGVTPFMVHHAVLAITVARLAGVDDVVVGAPIAGRTDPLLEALVGMFVNTLVLRTPVRSDHTVAEVLATVRTTDLDAFAHADAAFEQVVEQVAPVRSTSHSPLFQIALTYAVTEPGAMEAALDALGLSADGIDLGGIDAKVDLAVAVEESASGVRVGFSYATALFDSGTVDGFITVWRAVLAAVIADPGVIVGDIGIVDDDAAVLVGSGVRGGVVGPVGSATLMELLAARELDLGRAAVVSGEQVLAYQEFESMTNRVARSLIDRGVGAGDIVAVAVERSVESVVAVWGVVKSGAAFLPIDPRLPGDRIGFMVADGGASVGITTEAFRSGLPDHPWLTVAELDCAERWGETVSTSELVRAPRLDDLAYLIFTSGSTGRPKAVGVSHAGVAALAAGLAELTGPQTDPGSVRVLHVASPSFDASVLEMVWAFGLGATLVVAPADAVAGDGLSRVIADHGVTDALITPSVLATVDPGACGSVRRLTSGGEACGQELVERFAGLPGIEMFNLYGPSEATVWATAARLRPHAAVTIGRPIDGFTVRVLDARLHPVPRGVAGELYLSGAGLARGYLGRPGLTAGAFVADPFGATGARMYATGDIVRVNADGDIEYLGRGDDQVKVRGLRIELGEVEAALAAAPGVVYAVATVAEGPGGSQHVVGYVSSAGGPAVDLEVVKTAVGQSLPTYMVPTVWVVVEEFVRSRTGKLDRRALPAPDFSALAADYVAPEGAGELVVAEVFAQVLGVAVDQVSATASFFESGGNSLSAVQVCSLLREHTGRPFELTWMFADPTVRGVAAMIANGGPSAAPSWLTDVLITLKPDGELPPVFCIHPAGGLAWFFGGLAPFLPDRAVYGLQDPHVVAGEDGPSSIAGLAARYIEEIRTLRPEGPYHLLGWSLGGMIAQEMAVQLREAGLDVGVVGLMDAAPLTGEDLSAEAAAEATDYAELLGTWRDFFDVEQMEADAEATGDDVLELIRAQLRSAALIPDEVVDRVIGSFEGAAEIGAGHHSRHYGGDLLVFTAAADKDEPAVLSDSWRGLTDGEVVNHDIDVAHLEMSDTAALAVIGPLLAAALRRADGDGEA